MKNAKIKKTKYFIYLIPIIISILAIFLKNFVLTASCEKFFIVIKTIIMSESHLIFTYAYSIYYFGYIAIATYLLIAKYRKDKSKLGRRIELLWAFFGGITILFPLIFILLFPKFGIQFPSVYCEFALLFTIAAVLASDAYHKKIKKRL